MKNELGEMRLSVAISVYLQSSASQFREAMDSILQQTVPADEIILVADGPISDALKKDLLAYQQKIKELHTIFLEENQSLGMAMRIAVEKAKGKYIARMDSDDICEPNRFELQLKYLESHPEVSVVGGIISEFMDGTQETVGQRIPPMEDAEIKKYMRSRNGMNHVTVMFNREKLIEAGNYEPFYSLEDYYLWCRMMMHDCVFANIPEVLVKVRVSKEMYNRRGGCRYYKMECALFKFMKDNQLIGTGRFVYNLAIRGIVQFLLPTNIRRLIYQKFLRR